jgi:hypothetical protein
LYSPQAGTGSLSQLTEDSGAFKTNQVNSQQVPAFVMFPARPLPSGRTIAESFCGLPAGNCPIIF